jgi:glutathione synthase/RimK-type ligase-like ATP-grasp enzyme
MNKPNAVVLLNPGDRCSHMLDYYKKYNFVPIILRVCQDETKDISNDIDETIAKIKLRIKNLVVLNDKGQMSTAITLLKKYNVLAIVPYEETIIYGDLLAKKLHLNGNDPLTSVIRKNKYELNNLLAKKNVRAIKSRLLKKQDSVATIAKDFKFPLVMKPTYGSSSMNVFIISNMNELKDKFNFFKKTNIKNKKIFGDIIIQEFIEGLEYVANFISYNGKHILTDI